MKIYLSGPISGMARHDYMTQFQVVERFIMGRGHEVVNPTKLAPSRWLWIYRLIGYKMTLLYDLWHLFKCDHICMLTGWERSRGARLEKATAEIFEIPEIDISKL